MTSANAETKVEANLKSKGLEQLLAEKTTLLQELHTLDEAITSEHAELMNSRSPVFKLSDDLFALIFKRAIAETRSDKLNWGYGYNRPQKKPLAEVKISHVCWRFRSVVMQEAQIWAFFSNEGRDEDSQVERLKMYLERSGSCPLQLRILYHEPEVKGRYRDPRLQTESERLRRIALEMVRISLDHVHRWKQIAIASTVAFPDPDLANLREAMSQMEAPQLEYLHFHLHSGRDSDRRRERRIQSPDAVETQILNLGAPNLRYLNVNVTSYALFTPPLTQITTLCLGDSEREYHIPRIPWEVFLSMVQLPLVALSIANDCIEHPTSTPAGRITMKFLHHLRWGYGSSGSYRDKTDHPSLLAFLAKLDAPSLETMRLCDVRFPARMSGDLIAGMPFPKLVSFQLMDYLRLNEDWFYSLARGSPNVKEVVALCDDNRGKCLGRYLTRARKSGKPVWTKLEYLMDVLNLPNNETSVSDFDFVKYQSEGIGPASSKRFVLQLASETLQWFWEKDPAQLAKLEGLKAICKVNSDWMRRDVFPSGVWPASMASSIPGSLLVYSTCFGESSGITQICVY